MEQTERCNACDGTGEDHAYGHILSCNKCNGTGYRDKKRRVVSQEMKSYIIALPISGNRGSILNFITESHGVVLEELKETRTFNVYEHSGELVDGESK